MNDRARSVAFAGLCAVAVAAVATYLYMARLPTVDSSSLETIQPSGCHRRTLCDRSATAPTWFSRASRPAR